MFDICSAVQGHSSGSRFSLETRLHRTAHGSVLVQGRGWDSQGETGPRLIPTSKPWEGSLGLLILQSKTWNPASSGN